MAWCTLLSVLTELVGLVSFELVSKGLVTGNLFCVYLQYMPVLACNPGE